MTSWRLKGTGVALVLALAALTPVASVAAPTRYSLANGCYALQDGAGKAIGGAEHVRMKATTLASYLLYLPDGKFLAAAEGGGMAPAAEPSPASDWRVQDAPGPAFTIAPASDEKRPLTVRFTPAEGCADYPEAPLNAAGRPAKGDVPFGRVGGFVEGHMHWMTYEYIGGNFHCGRPWHPYGITHALPDCESVEGPQGAGAPVQNFLNFGNPAALHDTRGYPYLTEWGAGNLTYEGTYWRWIERAWMSGLRVMVMGINENRILCELQANRKTNCDEMDTVRRGIKAMRELQRYVDAQAGGPGKGFFQIVTDPYQARRVINEGKMAVVLEIEISEPFGCRGWETPSCDQAQVDRQLDEMYRLGVRSSLLLNKFDNPLTGVRFDGGPVGVVINAGNRQSAGSFWSARTCTGPLTDNTIETFVPEANSPITQILAFMGVPSGTLPTYPPAPHCNTRGLTTLGKHLVRRMMDNRMIVNPDHMSQAAVDDTLTLLESRGYSGVISPHGWMDPGNWPRLWKLGGMAFPGHTEADGYVKEWKQYRPERTPYPFGWGYGADLGGLSQQPRKTEGGISYPFKSYDGKVTFQRQRTGERTFDYAKEGVAHYGLYAEWFEDLRRIGGGAIAKDMWNGAEAYLQMWERAEGIRRPGCASPRAAITARGRGPLRLGFRSSALLRRAGQPQQRTRAWSWCVKGAGNRRAADVAVLSESGRVELVASTARGRSADGVSVGDPSAAGDGVHVRRDGRVGWVRLVRDGRVRAVGVATRSLAGRPADLTEAVARARSAKASSATPRFVPGKAKAAGLSGRPLAGSSNERLNDSLALLCRLQVQAG